MKTQTQLTKRTFLLWTGLILAAIGSYLFYFIMARMLSVEDYGLLYSLIALTYLFTIPHETIRTVISKYTTEFWVKKEKGKIKELMIKAIKTISLISIITFVIFLLLLPLWTKILHTNVWSISLIGLSLLITFMLPIIWGVLQGTNRFGHLGLNNSAEMVVKLALGIILVSIIGLGVNGAIIAIPLSIAAAFFIGFIPIRDIIKAKKKPFKAEKHLFRYSMSALIIFTFFVALYSIDIILARYFFSPLYAGLYSAVSVISKVLFFGSTAITRVMFSEIIEKHGKKKTEDSRKKSRKVLFRSLGFLAIMCGIFLFIAFIFPELIINVVVGNRYIAATPLLKYMMLAMAFFSFSSLIVFYNLSIDWHKKITAKILGSVAFLMMAFLILFHANLEQFVKVILAINIGLFLALLTTLKR
ncbi:MAG: oligosaccharide flippase family protein [Candidatus Pacearchaeota archaeon]|nr:MAG: oligosaccharide flippase family protein [Candidatus Pacearchaeota archaeon]